MTALSSSVALTFTGAASGIESCDLLFTSYRARLFRLAYRITGNHEDAEDAVQETLYRVVTKLNQFRGQAQFTTWLARIAINQSLSCLRQRKRHPASSLDEYLSGEGERPPVELRDTRPTPESTLFAGESKALLGRSIARLPRMYREIITLYYLHELSIVEVRRTLNLTESTVKSRLVRARRMLREQLGAAQ